MSSETSDGLENSDLARQILAQFKRASSERTLRQLYEAVKPPGVQELLEALRRLQKNRELRAFARVHSPFSGDPLKDFEDPDTLPEVMTTEEGDFEVTGDEVEIIYARSKA